MENSERESGIELPSTDGAAFRILDTWQRKAIKVIRYVGRYELLGIVVSLMNFLITGCAYFPESTFRLASKSRLSE